MKIILPLILIFSFVSPVSSVVGASSQNFATWLADVRTEARAKNISEHIITQALYQGMTPIAKVIELDRKQPEGTMRYSKYKQNTVSEARVKKGRALLKKHRVVLEAVSKKYNVQPRFIVALWGMETNYGGYTGNFNIVRSLATLAHDGRRSSYFRKELFNALKILDQGHILPSKMKGSWAGAMGQSQFMPSSFLSYAVDFNKDGKRDIWQTKQDVFASAANYLSSNGWHGDESWGRSVKIPKNFPKTLINIKVKKTLREWQALGVRKSDGSALPQVENMKASLVRPDKKTTETYIIYNNYRSIMRWNRSLYFATSVGLLADKISR